MRKERVYGPYRHRQRWRIEIAITDRSERTKRFESFATESEAIEFKRAIEREIRESEDAEALRAKAEYFEQRAAWYAAAADRKTGQGLTMAMAIEQYEAYLRDEKGNKPRSIETTIYRLRTFFGTGELTLSGLTERRAKALYEARRKGVSVDTHRNELGQARTFLKWCVSRGWIRRNPLDKVQPVGRRRCGKEQLRIEETRCLARIALMEANQGDDEMETHRDECRRESALGVLCALYLGLRASEIVYIHRRDVDDGGRLLWIPDSKTEAGRRTLEVPEVLRPLLVKRAAECSGRLFDHDRSWVLQNVKRLCRLAGVPEISAHGLRGMHATLATRAGSTAHEVARALGHTSPAVTQRHYIDVGTAELATRERLLRVLDGGRAGEPRSNWETVSRETVSQEKKPNRAAIPTRL